MSRSTAAVQIVDVTKVYRVGHQEYPALRGVSFKIERGELTSIMGPSGSGKSTLLNIIGALDRATSGRVFIDGVNISKLNENQLALLRNRRIGFVYQSFNLIQRLTAIENVELPLISRGTEEKVRKKRSLQLLSAVGLASALSTSPVSAPARCGQIGAAPPGPIPALACSLSGLVFPIGMSILAGLYPPWRASKMNIVNALKYE